ncbi:MAG: tetratricopeptide repeat protein [Bacteroidaceae bacterium]|nr:tetratricopeptide repeat protein [Bacteroidaceae bacterium]
MLLIFVCSTTAYSQTDRQYIRGGNKLYRAQKFDKAEIEYRKALEKNAVNPEALYNMGCAEMMQENDSLALDYFDKAAQLQKDKKRKAQIYHNAGVVMQNHKTYDKAIEAYKESLRNDPVNNETRYNLALCQKLLKKQQQNQNNQNNQDKNKDKKDNKNDNNKEKKQDKDKDQNKDKQDNDKKDKQDKQDQESKQDKINKENAEQILNAAKNQERAVQEKVKRAMQQRQNRSRQKNW